MTERTENVSDSSAVSLPQPGKEENVSSFLRSWSFFTRQTFEGEAGDSIDLKTRACHLGVVALPNFLAWATDSL